MSDVVVDTHIAIWYLASPNKLSTAAISALDAVQDSGGTIHLSAISIVEVAYLVEKGRLPEVVFERLLLPENGLDIVPLDLDIARALRLIRRDLVPDMPDRIIAATALRLGIPLVTCDSRLQQSGIRTIW